jgi:outer membrane protein TolC
MNKGLLVHRRCLNPTILLKAILVWGTLLLPWAEPGPVCAFLQTEKSAEVGEESQGALDFDTAVRICLKRSPFLIKSSLEIDVRRLDETDSRYSFVPTISVRTRYYVNRPSQAVGTDPYVLEFVTDGYNPIEAYFSLQARKLLTQIAILAHHQVISKGLYLLAQHFLELTMLHRLTTAQGEVVILAQKNLAYLRERLKLGEITTLEVQIACQELALAQAEKDRLLSSQSRLKEEIRSFMGLKPDQTILFNLQPVTQQVLGAFDAAAASLAEARRRSFELKIQALAKELQAMKVMLAKAKILPTFYMGVQSAEPLYSGSERGLFYSVGLSWPVWDGFQRIRDISRQKTILKQYDADLELKDLDLSKAWGEAQEKLGTAQAALKLAQSQEELAQLKGRQNEIRYLHEGEGFSSLITGQRGFLEAQKNTLLKLLESEQARLLLRYLSGDLVCHYVAESSWKN